MIITSDGGCHKNKLVHFFNRPGNKNLKFLNMSTCEQSCECEGRLLSTSDGASRTSKVLVSMYLCPKNKVKFTDVGIQWNGAKHYF